MWKQIKASQYFFCMIKDGAYELFVTDYMSIWTIKLSAETFLFQMKNCNEGLELEEDADFVRKGLYLLDTVDTLKRFKLEVDPNNESVTFTMGVSFGYPFYFACRLFKGSKDLFFKMVTQPLLKTVCDLRASQVELRYLLRKKDTEIEEYKYEGGEIVLKHIKTVPYDDDEHMTRHHVYDENYGFVGLPSSLVEKEVEVPPQKTLELEHIFESDFEPEPTINTEYEQNEETDNESNSGSESEENGENESDDNDENVENESEKNVEMESETNMETEPVPNIKTEPDLDIDVKPALDIDVKPALDIDVKPALEIDTKPAIDIDTKPALDIDTKSTLDIKTEPVSVKTENNTEVSGESSTASASQIKQEVVKTETRSTNGSAIPRKRSKFNF